MYDYPEVRELAKDPRRVSDYLGNLWRAGTLSRLPAPRSENSAARWAYQYRAPKNELKNPNLHLVDYTPKNKLVDRPEIKITEEGDAITIELHNFKITVQTRQLA
jgi:hypothetical protein